MIALIAFTARLAAAQPDEALTDGTSPIGPAETSTETLSDDPSSSDPAESASFDPTWSDAAESASASDPAWSDPAESASFDPAWSDAGAADDRETARQQSPTRLGRVDLTITWRRTLRVADTRTIHPDAADATHAIASPLDPVTTARGVLWVLLTWSR